MNSEQWQTAWRVFNAARELPPGEQRRFVESESADPEIVQRVFEELEAHLNAEDEEVRSPAPAHIDRAGTQVGRYRVGRLLGRGGMGEVYAAKDTDLGRQVALKFLLPWSIGDATAVKRFVREAKAASALNHPNILTIYEVIDSSSGLAIAMELVEGEPLSALRGCANGWRHVAQIGSQTAAALAAAHEQGIVHGDIKPENLMLRPDGIVKVLDFGLAQSFGGKGAPAFQTSVSGLPGGTLRYMSPEQLRNEPLTGASDVYSLGLALYELIAGRHPFQSEYAFETAYAIHTRDAQALSGDTPAWLDELIVSMLNRDAALRPEALGVVSALSQQTWDGSRPKTRRPRAKWKWIPATIAATAVAAAGWFLRDELPPWRLKAVEFTQYPGDEDSPSFSPDGQSVAFVWSGAGKDTPHIFIRPIGSTALKQVTTDPAPDYSPAWSPDGRAIAFLRKPPRGRAGLFLVPPGGGSERKIADILSRPFEAVSSLAWTPDGKWLVVPSRETESDPLSLFLISTVDGAKRQLTRPSTNQIDVDPTIAPNGRMMAFTRAYSESVNSIYLLPLSSAFLAAGEPQPLLPGFRNLRVGTPQWTRDSKELLFAANPETGMAIWRAHVAANGEALQAPRQEPFAERSFRIRIGPPSAEGRRLMYSTEVQERSLRRVGLGTPGGSPPPQRIGSLAESNCGARISPDGSHIVFESMRTGSTEVWVANIDGTKPRQLTRFGGPVTGSASWSPDGRRIAFDSRAEGRPDIYVVPVDGGRPERITEALADNLLPAWSRDGRWVYFCSSRSGAFEVWRMPPDGRKAEQLTRGGGWAPAESPDGGALYYQRRSAAGWSLRRLTLETGQDVEVIPAVTERAFAVGMDGIYYVPAQSQSGRSTIQFFDLRTGASRLVTPIGKPMNRCLALAPNGSFLLYSQLDRWGLDLMLVENFH